MATNTSQYVIKEAIVKKEIGDGCLSIDIRSMVVELQLFEDIRLPFVTGKIMIIDPKNVLDEISYTGTEKLQLSIKGMVDGKEISKNFFLKKRETTTDKKDMYVFNIAEEHAWFWSTTKIQDSFNGKMEDIISSIYKKYMGKEINDFNSKESIQQIIKYVIPNKTLKEILPTFIKEMCTDLGAPYFSYATLYSDEIFLSSYDEIMEGVIFNEYNPFKWSPSNMTANIENNDERGQFYSILKINLDKTHNENDLYTQGLLNSETVVFNISNGEETKVDVEIEDQEETINLKKEGCDNRLFNKLGVVMNGIDITEDKTKKDFVIKDNNLYVDYKPFSGKDDDTYEVTNPSESIKKKLIQAKNTRKYISNNVISIMVQGAALWENEIGVGSSMKLLFTKKDNVKQNTYSDIIDKDLSGYYIITQTKHMFVEEKHTVQLNVAKLS